MFNILQLLIFFLLIAIILVVFMAVKAQKINKEIKVLTCLRQSDITETNKLFINKSENELKLFFQFETILEEMIKLLRKADGQNLKIINTQDDIKLLLEITLKKDK